MKHVEVGLPGGHSDFKGTKDKLFVSEPPPELDYELWVGRKIQWDPTKEVIVGDKEASKLLTREYRKPWKLG